MRNARRIEILTAMLILTFMVCGGLWYLRTYYVQTSLTTYVAYSESGVWDLRSVDFDNTIVELKGNVEYIEGEMHTPESFAEAHESIELGMPKAQDSGATVRMKIILPDNQLYTLDVMGDYARSVYTNGQWRAATGTPATTAEDFEPGFGAMILETQPENNVIELVQQGGNFVHRTSSGYDGVWIGYPETVEWHYNVPAYTEYFIIGIFFSLFLLFLLLALMMESQKLHVLFALLCLAWGLRLMSTGTKLFLALFQYLDWEFVFRMEYMTMPLVVLLLMELLMQVYSNLFNKYLYRTICTVFLVFFFMFAYGSTVFISTALIYFHVAYTLVMVALFIAFVRRFPHLIKDKTVQAEQIITVLSLVVLAYTAIHDGLYYFDIYLFGVDSMTTDFGMMVFCFFMSAAIVYSTTRRITTAVEAERTMRRHAQELENFSQMRSQFMTVVAHEIKTPLSVIMGAASETVELLEDEEPMMDIVLEDQLMIIETVKDVNKTVFDLLDITALETGRLSIDLGLVRVDVVLKLVANQYRSTMEKAGNKIVLEVEPDLPRVMGDEKRLRQVVLNLVSNASRHTKDGTVTLGLRREGEYLRISVRDSGVGMDEALLSKLTTGIIEGGAHGYRGGVGLMICQQIIASHGGQLDIESREGYGTTASFTLPIGDESDE